MATTVFTSQNLNPTLIQEDQNWTNHIFMAKKSAGLTIDSASGLYAPGPVRPGSYSSPMETGTNKTELGAVKTPSSLHYNSQAMTVQFGVYGLTPFGMKIKNKNTIAQTITYGTGSTTVVNSSGTTTGLELTSATNFAEGQMIEIQMPNGEFEYRRIAALDSADVTFDYPLFEAPDDAATVKHVTKIRDKPGGTRPEKYSLLSNMSGDYQDRLLHFMTDVRVSDGNYEMPDSDAGGINFTLDVFPQKETISGRVEPIFMVEDLVFEDLS